MSVDGSRLRAVSPAARSSCSAREMSGAAPSSAKIARAARRCGRASLRRWEPRINVVDVVVEIATDDPALLYIDVRYTVTNSNDPRNLVFPFYVIPAEP